ncbi:glutamyl-tRNA reductase [Ammoniphilus sp. YIM 78166]|uniref:glutamyl-tRNA reductase n=1 Tax=Ammoniphilus sp. YIM 78166 TaxID=1644106 RepID=UPI00106F9195|nr:glutamyl-tRNA reductase [Ammoniphilus sp. YIM 78166]
MHILVIGLNYQTASVIIRERLSFTKDSTETAIQTLRKKKSIQECVIVGTCNRTEIYCVVDQVNLGTTDVTDFLREWFGINEEEFEPFLYVKEDDEAIKHLFRVVCGLDSMVLGETQILGQVKESFNRSQGLKSTGTLFNRLFRQAIALAKRVHTETDISMNAVSVSYAAIELGKKIFSHIQHKTVVILGAGEMGELTGKHLVSQGVNQILVVNRTYDRAERLAEILKGTALEMGRLSSALVQADIVISSTGAKDYVIRKQEIQTLLQKRDKRPLYMIDMGVPRDIEPSVNQLNHVYLYNMDDLQGIVDENLSARKKEARKIEGMIEEERVAFQSWLGTLGVIPLIAALREKTQTMQEEAVRHIENKLPHLTDHEIQIIRKSFKVMVNQILHDPFIQMKELAGSSNQKEFISQLSSLFGLEENTQTSIPFPFRERSGSSQAGTRMLVDSIQ